MSHFNSQHVNKKVKFIFYSMYMHREFKPKFKKTYFIFIFIEIIRH